MDKIDYQVGDAVPTTQTLNYAQDSLVNGFRSLLLSFTEDQAVFKIHGVVRSTTVLGSTATESVTAGSVSFNGEPIDVDAHSLDRDVSEVAWLQPDEEYIDAIPTNNSEGVGRSVKVKRRMVLAKGSNYPATGSYMSLDAKTQLDILKLKLSGRLMPLNAIFPYAGSLGDFTDAGLGKVDTPARGLAICNGNTGTNLSGVNYQTIDMRGLVAAGAVNVPDDGSGSLPVGVDTNTNVGDVFGEETHVLLEAEMPEHSHEYQKGTFISGDADLSGSANDNNRGLTTENTSAAGSGEAHENRQPTRALLYVQVIE